MAKVQVEFFFPLSRAVKKESTGRVSLALEIKESDTVRSLMARLVRRYRGLRNVFDMEKQEPLLMVLIAFNNSIITSNEVLDTGLKDGDYIGLLPEYVGG